MASPFNHLTDLPPDTSDLPEIPQDPTVALFFKLKNQFGLYTGGELARRVRKLPATGYLVEGMIPPCSVNILVGDSGIGKSPLVYQMALAVAAGMPFLGQATRAAKVILVDYENTLWDSHRMLQQQRKNLGLQRCPYTLLIWPMNNMVNPEAPETDRQGLQQQTLTENVEKVIYQFGPGLVILDSLRSFNPAMESDNAAAADQIKRLREIARRHGTAILLVHHVRKLGLRHTSHLEDHAPLDWLMRSAGARALINQTDARLAIAVRKGEDGNQMLLRGHIRTQGEVGPYIVERVWDDAGEPLAYRRFCASPAMLNNPEQEEVFTRLPVAFSFGEACKLYGKQNAATSLFLTKLIRLGLLHKTGHGQYRRIGIEAVAA